MLYVDLSGVNIAPALAMAIKKVGKNSIEIDLVFVQVTRSLDKA
jgi:hypothetical protein